MKRGTLLWLAAVAAISVLVSVQVLSDARTDPLAGSGAPTVGAGIDVLAGVREVPRRVRAHDYRRAAFGRAWDDDTGAPGGRNGCDTRNDILNRDLLDKTSVAITRCPQAVATGTLRDPYTNATIAFSRGHKVGASVQIDHIVPLAYAWDMGARDWPEEMRKRFANDPANLIAVAGQANQDKGDQPPGAWMPPNRAFRCQYAVQFIEVLRGYRLPVDQDSAQELREATQTCPVG